MKYAIWYVRLVFAAWMIPAGLNHFIRLFPQPMGNQPLSHELIVALIDSRLFDIVKAVELLAGIGVLTGFFGPLAVLVCVPVSFCVFWWDAPLEGWRSRAALFGEATLLCNVVLCLAYIRSYGTMFTLRVTPQAMKQLVLVGRIVFGAWMLANGANHFFFALWVEPAGTGPLAMQLMDGFVHSGLFDVAMAIELVAGALILTGLLVPVALCVVMPVSTCALYWSVVLEHRPLGAVLALVAFGLNGLLMLAHLHYYRGALQRHALTAGEATGGPGESFESAYVYPGGRTSRSHFMAALVTLLLAVVFYKYLVTGRTAQWCIAVLLIPGTILLARRLRDMGYSAWLLLAPLALMIVAFARWLGIASLGAPLDTYLPSIALVVAAGFALWGCMGGTREKDGGVLT
jgi:uncharacterized membrane protein YhaH (DUF805 family)/uncharacterized membrane protein YphA (DoxX/SURF4 family)